MSTIGFAKLRVGLTEIANTAPHSFFAAALTKTVNAMCESYNATLECELLVQHRVTKPREAALAVFDFIEGFYNTRRRHTALGSISPTEFERRSAAA